MTPFSYQNLLFTLTFIAVYLTLKVIELYIFRREEYLEE